jgi:hypothetical protein
MLPRYWNPSQKRLATNHGQPSKRRRLFSFFGNESALEEETNGCEAFNYRGLLSGDLLIE